MRIEFIGSISDIPAEQWDAVWFSSHSSATQAATRYPFVKHAFLLALEQSGCTTAETGWEPYHCIAWDGDRLAGALPLYIKSHSYGEYVFDWAWANAYHQAGLHYYPKFLNAIPFTPATGPRWVAEYPQAFDAMREAIFAEILRLGLSGLHSLFPSRLNTELKEDGRFLQRIDCQYHWFNRGYDDFNSFLDSFTSRKRKNINKERSKVTEQGFHVEMVEGAKLTERDWRQFYLLYRQTYRKRSGHDGYLNSDFFQRIGASMRDSVVMAWASIEGRLIAAALYFKDEKTLFGRYWGALDEYDGLHFECCYYQGIEYAIRHQLERFDPGAQGEHKILRGFTPVLTRSLHYLHDERFATAITRFLREETQHVLVYCTEARQQLPFKSDHHLIAEDVLINSGWPL